MKASLVTVADCVAADHDRERSAAADDDGAEAESRPLADRDRKRRRPRAIEMRTRAEREIGIGTGLWLDRRALTRSGHERKSKMTNGRSTQETPMTASFLA